MNSPLQFFAEIKNLRLERTKDHLLLHIIFITIAAVICGAETWNDSEAFGKAKKEWLKSFLRLPGRKI